MLYVLTTLRGLLKGLSINIISSLLTASHMPCLSCALERNLILAHKEPPGANYLIEFKSGLILLTDNVRHRFGHLTETSKYHIAG